MRDERKGVAIGLGKFPINSDESLSDASESRETPQRQGERASVPFRQKQVGACREKEGLSMGRMCEQKKRYETESEAIRMGLAYTRHSGGGIRVYLCPICKGWHLTTHAEDGTSLKNEFAKS